MGSRRCPIPTMPLYKHTLKPPWQAWVRLSLIAKPSRSSARSTQTSCTTPCSDGYCPTPHVVFLPSHLLTCQSLRHTVFVPHAFSTPGSKPNETLDFQCLFSALTSFWFKVQVLLTSCAEFLFNKSNRYGPHSAFWVLKLQLA